MREDFASIVRFVMDNVGNQANAHIYFENIKDGFGIPAFYFPQPEEEINQVSLLNGYLQDCSCLLQIFAATDEDAMVLANKVKKVILNNNEYIPVIDFNGNNTGEIFRVIVKKINRIDEGLAQVSLSWKYDERYNNIPNDKIKDISFNLSMKEGKSIEPKG